MVTQLDIGHVIKGAYDEAEEALRISIVNDDVGIGGGGDSATETTLADLNSKFGAIGQRTSAQSASIVPASDTTFYTSSSDDFSTGAKQDAQNLILTNIENYTLTTAQVLTGTEGSCYTATITGLSPASSATDIFTLTVGSVRDIRILRCEISGTATTAGAYDIVFLTRSSANSGGTSSTLVGVNHYDTGSASDVVVQSYTANPSSLGTLVGSVRSRKITVSTSAGAIPNVPNEFYFTGQFFQPITLTVQNSVFAINLNGATMTGGSLNIDITWQEV